MKKLNKTTAAILSGFLFCGSMVTGLFSKMANLAHADETLGDKVQDAGTDVKRDTKKSVRGMKRSGRKATGNDNVLKDGKDALNDAGDNIEAGAKKAKRKHLHHK